MCQWNRRFRENVIKYVVSRLFHACLDCNNQPADIHNSNALTFFVQINPKSVGEFSRLLRRRRQPVQTIGFHPNTPLPSQETLKLLKVASPKRVIFDLIRKFDPQETDSASEGEDEFHIMEPLKSL